MWITKAINIKSLPSRDFEGSGLQLPTKNGNEEIKVLLDLQTERCKSLG